MLNDRINVSLSYDVLILIILRIEKTVIFIKNILSDLYKISFNWFVYKSAYELGNLRNRKNVQNLL